VGGEAGRPAPTTYAYGSMLPLWLGY